MQENGQNSGKGGGDGQSNDQTQSPMAPYARQSDEPAPNRPVETIRQGNLKASIWANEGDYGTTYQTTFSRSWRDDQGQWHDSQSYSNNDLLGLGELSRSAYHRTNELRREQTMQQDQRQDSEDQRQMDFRQKRSANSIDKGRERRR